LDPVKGVTASITLVSGENNPTLDAGFYLLPANLGDFVFVDSNRNGIQDGNEPGIQGVTATLYINGVSSPTTTTNASGLYAFTGLNRAICLVMRWVSLPRTVTPLQYRMRVVMTPKTVARTGGKTQSVTRVASAFNSTLDAGFFLPETIQLLIGIPQCNTLTITESVQVQLNTGSNAVFPDVGNCRLL
jgi:hypothetical protein